MKTLSIFFTGLLLVLTASCSSTIEQYQGEFTPISYQRYVGSAPKTIGKLRKLALVPINYQYVMNGEHDRIKEKNYSASLHSYTLEYLTDEKGYVLFDAADLDADKTRQLMAWVGREQLGARAPNDLMEIIREIGSKYLCDGVLLVNSYQSPRSSWVVWLTILSASLTWPLLFIENQWDSNAYIIETHSGVYVWHANAWDKMFSDLDIKPDREQLQPALFLDMEPAAPAVLTE